MKTSKGESTLRPARVTDAPAFRALRLEALHNHPESFSSDYATNFAFPSTFWEQRLNDLGQAGSVFFADFQGDLNGMCGIHRESSPKLQHTATIWGVYVKEDFRERRFGLMFRRGGPFGEGFMGFGPLGDPEGPESPDDDKEPDEPLKR